MQTSKLTQQGDASLFQNYDFARLAEKVRGAYNATMAQVNQALPKKMMALPEEEVKAKFKRIKTIYDAAR